MKIVQLTIATIIFMAHVGVASSAPLVDKWADQVAWRFKIALQRTPLHLTPVRTTAEIKLVAGPTGEIQKVEVQTRPISKTLNIWLKNKLESIKRVHPFHDGKTHRIYFSANYDPS